MKDTKLDHFCVDTIRTLSIDAVQQAKSGHLEAHETLRADRIRSRVVSMPSRDIFEHQTPEYRDSVLPSTVTARVAVEQASTLGWERYVGSAGRVIGMHRFGASAPLEALQKKFGFQPDHVVAAAREQLGR